MERQQQHGRHDGTSPLPLAMDWSHPPFKWNGRDTVWPQDSHIGWRYCVTIPSWLIAPQATDMDPKMFYRVRVALQSPKGITTTRTALRKYDDFLELRAALRNMFPSKNLPPVPPKQIVRLQHFQTWKPFEQRRRTMEDWIIRLLSDFETSRSMLVATFFELEFAARSSFRDENQQIAADGMSLNSDLTDALERIVTYGTPSINQGLSMGHTNLEQVNGSLTKDESSSRGSISLDTGFNSLSSDGEVISTRGCKESSGLSLVLPDMDNLLLRLNQEIALNYHLTTKVKDLQEELETTKRKSRENLQQAILERERLTQMQCDMDELQRKSLDMELKLESLQGDKTKIESSTISVIQEDQVLHELDVTRNKFKHLLKKHQELEAESKEDVIALVKEVKSLRSTQAQLTQQLNESLEGKSNAEKLQQQEKQISEKEKADRMKLIHDCESLHNRFLECRVNLLNESADSICNNSSSLQSAKKLLQNFDYQIEILLAEAHFLLQDDKQEVLAMTDTAIDYELKNELSKSLIDNITLRKIVSSVFHYALKRSSLTGKDDAEIPAQN